MDIESISSNYIPPPAPEITVTAPPPPPEEIPVSDANIAQSTIDIIA